MARENDKNSRGEVFISPEGSKLSTKIEVCRQIHFCAGHRLMDHEEKCVSLHGHNYEAVFHATGETLDSVGRIIDFGVLKQKLGSWLDENWDHAMILSKHDNQVIEALQGLPGQRLYLLPYNPTVENMATYLLREVSPKLLEGTGVKIVRVGLRETPNCHVEVSLES